MAEPAGPGGPARPRAVLFDWDNTLVDNWATIADALNITLAAMGHETWSEAEVRARVRASARDAFPAWFGARWREATRIFYDRFESAHLTTLRAMDGADDCVRALARAGYYLGVVSNKRGDLLRKEADALGWTPLFGRLVGANDARADKPAADPIRLALEGSAIESGAAVWYVGDAGIDIECARNAGCVAVLVGDGHGEIAGLEPDIRVASCRALAKLLDAP